MSLPNGAAGPSMTSKYMWVDGVYVKAGLEKEKAAVLVSDGSKVVVSTVPGYRESTENWSEVLRDIKRRGLSCPRLVVGDGHLGIWGALRNGGSRATLLVLAKLPKRQQDQAKLRLGQRLSGSEGAATTPTKRPL